MPDPPTVRAGHGEVAVVGATGLLGGTICRTLCARGESVRALVRPATDRAARRRLEVLGARVFEGDMEIPASLDACFEGVDAVVSTASSFPHDPRPDAIDRVDRDGQLAVVTAAERARVRRVVYVSFPPIPFDFPFQRAKRAVEDRLRASGIDYVVLQPAKFMDVWFTPPLGFDVEERVRLYGDGTTPQSWIAVADVAEVAAQVLRLEEASRTTLAFGGPEALPQSDVVRVFEHALGRSLETESMAVSELEAMQAGAVSPLEESLAAILLDATLPERIEPSLLVGQLGLTWTSVADFAAARFGDMS
jgi:uncharacterized protein YbjT (DUF2867 family)